LVDGVSVGDGSPAVLRYCCIETIQVIWSHNCEHGVLRGLELVLVNDDDTDSSPKVAPTSIRLRSTGSMIEFGPEQLIVRIPVEWVGGSDEDNDKWTLRDCLPLVSLKPNEWIQ
jgi:hypothetical protein